MASQCGLWDGGDSVQSVEGNLNGSESDYRTPEVMDLLPPEQKWHLATDLTGYKAFVSDTERLEQSAKHMRTYFLLQLVNGFLLLCRLILSMVRSNRES